MKGKSNLSKTWVLVQCGTKRFTLNYNFISSLEDFKQAECLYTTTADETKRGVYNILGMDLLVLDGRKLLGEPSISSLKLKFSEDIHKLKISLLEWIDSLEWFILQGKEVELDYMKLDFYSWVISRNGNTDMDRYKDRILATYKEIFMLASNIVNESNIKDKDINELLCDIKDIKETIEKEIFKQMNRVITAYNKSFEETCLIIKHKGRRYGLTIDKILAITEHVNVKPLYSEYKIVAGKCIYQDECYDVFNIKYITELAKKLESN